MLPVRLRYLIKFVVPDARFPDLIHVLVSRGRRRSPAERLRARNRSWAVAAPASGWAICPAEIAMS
jgi:hypothetical protein